MSKASLSSKDGFEAAAELLWRSEIITSACAICKGKRNCYSPFLLVKTKEQTGKILEKIRLCKIRKDSVEEILNDSI